MIGIIKYCKAVRHVLENNTFYKKIVERCGDLAHIGLMASRLVGMLLSVLSTDSPVSIGMTVMLILLLLYFTDRLLLLLDLPHLGLTPSGVIGMLLSVYQPDPLPR